MIHRQGLSSRIFGLVAEPLRRNTSFFVFMYVLGVVVSVVELPDKPDAKLYDNLWPELLLDLLQAGNLPINALPPGRRLGRPALLVLLEPLQRLPHHLAVICHVPAPLPFHKLLQGAVLFLRGLRLVILLHLPKRPQALLIPAAQDAV